MVEDSDKSVPEDDDAPKNDAPESNSDDSSTDESSDGPQRRGFVAGLIAVIVGSIAGLWSMMTGLVVICDPLFRKQKVPKMYEEEGGSGEGFVRVASLDSVPADGVPRRFAVIKDVVDAWTFSPNQPVGAVWIKRDEGAGEEGIKVFHATCPHAGCSVSYRADTEVFLCPCHNSSFDVNGQMKSIAGKDNPSPRPMDELEYQVDDSQNINVEYMDFYTGIHDKKPKI